MRRMSLAIALAGVLVWAATPAVAQSQEEGDPLGLATPVGPGAQKPKPDLTDIERLRFVTDDDYPPFNYLDEDGSLTGFNADLARAICEELAVECEVRTVSWDAMLSTLGEGAADAAIASIRTNAQTLTEADFTESYYHTPARFVARRDSDLDDVDPETLEGRKVGVVAGTTHELFLRDFFGGAEITVFEDAGAAKRGLREGEVELLFGDGITLMFWLNGTASNACCEFRGGPYTESKYFGEGIGIAVKRGNGKMRDILEYGLEQARATGRFEELLLRYFPMSVF